MERGPGGAAAAAHIEGMQDPIRQDDRLADRLLEEPDEEERDGDRLWDDLQAELTAQSPPPLSEEALTAEQWQELQGEVVEGYSESVPLADHLPRHRRAPAAGAAGGVDRTEPARAEPPGGPQPQHG